MMLYRYKQAFYIIVLLFTYFLLFYLLLKQKLNSDFNTFYSAALAYFQQLNPYAHLSSSFLIQPTILAVNVNPPFFIFLISLLIYFNYSTASLIWSISSLIFGLIGWLLCFSRGTNKHFFKKNVLVIILIYLASYACLMNTSFNQVAGFLLFFLMLGYYYYRKKSNDYFCGFFWGVAVALKLFPGLLFIFVLIEKRYKVFWMMLSIFILSWSLPLFTRGSEIYFQFFNTLGSIVWYGNTWNASLLAYLFRLFVDMNHPNNVLWIKIIYLLFFTLLLFWYIKKLNQLSQSHYRFCLSLIMMLLLSPFGWMYYFALLAPVLILIYQTFQQEEKLGKIVLWSTCLFLLNWPLENIQTRELSTFFEKSTLYSIYFYGLCMVLGLFLYVIKLNPKTSLLKNTNNEAYIKPVEFILGFSVLIVFSTLLKYIIALNF